MDMSVLDTGPLFHACAYSSPQAFPSPSLKRPGNETSYMYAVNTLNVCTCVLKVVQFDMDVSN